MSLFIDTMPKDAVSQLVCTQQGNRSFSPLHILFADGAPSARHPSSEVLVKLLSMGRDALYLRDTVRGLTPIHMAVIDANMSALSFMLIAVPDAIDILDFDGKTAADIAPDDEVRSKLNQMIDENIVVDDESSSSKQQIGKCLVRHYCFSSSLTHFQCAFSRIFLKLKNHYTSRRKCIIV